MWKVIKIKPNDQSLCGRKIATDFSSTRPLNILFVGKQTLVVIDENGTEWAWTLNRDYWLIWEEDKPKKLEEDKPKKLLARAFVKNGVSLYAYSSKEEAEEGCKPDFISWPALLNKDGYYEVPE